ncbi:hypothetical protein BD414DRAFT_494907 [Trametes punicea]|nr:hypothetical protein BD414DRAFT_494907 [Trametes punicea]
MSSVSTDPQLAAEFVKFLNAQLKECREQLHKSTQDNAYLRQQLEAQGSSAPLVPAGSVQDTIAQLKAEVDRLKAELAAARADAEARESEASTRRWRYDVSKGSTAESLSGIQKGAASDKILENMRMNLVGVRSATTLNSAIVEQYMEFQTFMANLSGSNVTPDQASESRVVFDLPKLQILSKPARNACDGGFGFFGNLLRWCAEPSQNAILYCPEYHYTPNNGNHVIKSWSPATEWTSLIGSRYELFDTDGGQLVYVGTFLFHKGPNDLDLRHLPTPADEGVITELAQRTFKPDTKSQRAKAKVYLPALGEMYKQGETTVQILGLQRVGFNNKLFEILRRAYHKRGKMRAGSSRARSETARSMSPDDKTWSAPTATTKRAREEDGGEGDGEGGRSDDARLSKQLRTGDFEGWDDQW